MVQVVTPFTKDAQLEAARTPPHSIEAEQSVLGGLLLDNVAWDRIGDVITEADFYRGDHRTIFQHIAKLIEQNQPADALTVAESLERSGKLAALEDGPEQGGRHWDRRGRGGDAGLAGGDVFQAVAGGGRVPANRCGADDEPCRGECV